MEKKGQDRPDGTPFSFGSCEKEYCVFAMQTIKKIRELVSRWVRKWRLDRGRTRKVAIALRGVSLDLLLRLFAQLDAVGSVDLF